MGFLLYVQDESPVPDNAIYSVKNHWQAFVTQLEGLLRPEQLIRDVSRRTAYSTDASFYHLTPRLVLKLDDITQIQRVLKLACRWLVPVTFRAAGTSLSGQAISDSVLILLSTHWRQADVLDDGARIRLQPGVVGAYANQVLAPFNRKIGPDPASIATCKIGGIAANNASGMCCGVKHNSYHTMEHMTFVLADGTRVDTSDPRSVKQFYRKHDRLINDIRRLRAEVCADEILTERIRHQYRFKNTLGYGLNALLDFENPVDIISHLMIGSEGTLGFIADITYRTIKLPAFKAAGLYLFESADDACDMIETLARAGADAVELMDARALRSVADLLAPFSTRPVSSDNVALLIELTADQQDALDDALDAVTACFHAGQSIHALQPFTRDTAVITTLWSIRKGLFPAVGAIRQPGTTVIIEDVAFDQHKLAQGIALLQQLFEKYGYDEAIIFGHALDGNVHFVFTQRFDRAEEKARYRDFMQDVSTLVTDKLHGTLKAEHGTGRNMAPFIRQQWGGRALDVMKRLKHVLDPADILNPGVIINDDPQAHLKDLKQLPPIDEEIDSCIECGFCEPQCPSASLTLSPRQRIALMRRAALLPAADQAEIEQDFAYLGDKTCAATGLCATACPVGINTGTWIKKQRHARSPDSLHFMAEHLPLSHSLARGALRLSAGAAAVTSKKTLQKITRTAHTLSERIPVFASTTPPAASTKYATGQSFSEQVVYIPACPNRVFGGKDKHQNLNKTVVELLNKAKIAVRYPDALTSLCCGQPFESHGNMQAAQQYRERFVNALQTASENGRYPIITDNSTCALSSLSAPEIKVTELTQYLNEVVAPRLLITPVKAPVALHVSCSSQHLDGAAGLRALADKLCDEIFRPSHISCCGFAGDKGFTTPELNQAALSPLREQLPANCHRGISNSRTCEIGLSQASGIPYEHIAYLMNEVSEPLHFQGVNE
ncbi:FAD-binding oxidoreductase [Salinimonas sp. HHU 13199]|uniref:D-lactate dehydrogenase (cytochrome) n=1 Tax=Salinimonas profundi TaxID=2729140 RepID=A0ABR8LLZ1_9ALTE|nr:FAD-binding and (Fe-S)-binding domain-containing protein [Salinimonas profundi]MBD3586747.1 FAD-binding oxidoreductase [Salinimonas profundi]